MSGEEHEHEHVRNEPPLWAKIVLVTLATGVVVFLLFCIAIILLWLAKGLWGITFG